MLNMSAQPRDDRFEVVAAGTRDRTVWSIGCRRSDRHGLEFRGSEQAHATVGAQELRQTTYRRTHEERARRFLPTSAQGAGRFLKPLVADYASMLVLRPQFWGGFEYRSSGILSRHHLASSSLKLGCGYVVLSPSIGPVRVQGRSTNHRLAAGDLNAVRGCCRKQLALGCRTAQTTTAGHEERADLLTTVNQLDYAFASRGFHEKVSVLAMNEIEEWGPSDHCRLMIEVKVKGHSKS